MFASSDVYTLHFVAQAGGAVRTMARLEQRHNNKVIEENLQMALWGIGRSVAATE